jgi:ribosomal protein S18 acetylase RimI-like enzyme
MIRLAIDVDAERISALVNQAYRPDSDAMGWTHETELISGPRISTAQVVKLIGGAGTLLVASDNRGLIGCVHVEPAGGECYIGMLATHPTYQNQGLGRRLLDAAEKLAVDQYNATGFRISLLSFRPELMAYYERRGYKLTGTHSPYPIDAQVGTPRSQDLQVLDMVKRALSTNPS